MKKVVLFFTIVVLAGCTGPTKDEQSKAQPPASRVEVAKKEVPQPVQPQAVEIEAQAVVPEVEPAIEREFETFVVYTDKNSRFNHFIPSGWMGDYSDIKFNDGYTENPHSGETCIRIEYLNLASNGARWAGIYWQYPQNNWGNVDQSYDLTGAKKLTFWGRGEKGSERIQEFKIGGISGEYSDSDSVSIGPITLTSEWQKYEIDLGGKDLSHIIGGFCWATNIDVNPEGAIFYLDDIQYE